MMLGYASWVLPYVLIAGPVEGEMPLLIHFSSDPDIAKWVVLVCLFLSGLAAGFFAEGDKWAVMAGSATVFPVITFALAEMFLGLASHNLWPIEFGMYAVFTMPAIVGALLSVFVKSEIIGSSDV
jgi:hypothetical protein